MAYGQPRDPVSVLFDGTARALLDRAYANRGEWVATWLADPGIRTRSRFLAQGINVDGPDPLPKGGGVDAQTRWARGFIRSIYYQHKWYSPNARGPNQGWKKDRRLQPRSGGLRIQVGRHVPASPQWDPANPRAGGLPPRRRVRLQLATGGKAKDAAVARLGNRDRIYAVEMKPGGELIPGARWGGGGRYRDWGMDA